MSARSPGLGTMTLTGGYGRVDPTRATAVLAHAAQQGVALVDTADAYIGGEELVASVRGACPEHPFRVVTKVGLTGRPGQRLACGQPDHLKRACEASLRRLGGERLDILLLHRVDPDVAIEISMSALADLVEVGKVAEIGLCTSDPQVLRRAAQAAPVSYVQAAMSVLAPMAAGKLLPTARELGTTLLAFSPLGRGLVAADRDPASLPIDDARAHTPDIGRVSRATAEDFRRLAKHLRASPVDLALSWLTSLGPDVVPIPGARSREQVSQTLDAQRRPLSLDERWAIEAFVRAINDSPAAPEPTVLDR